MTYEEIEEQFPDEWKLRAADKLAYRYPRGESYLDVIARLEPIIIEMERHQEPLLIVAHQGILRIIYAFYMGLSRAEAPYVTIKLNCVTELTPMVYGCTEKVRRVCMVCILHPLPNLVNLVNLVNGSRISEGLLMYLLTLPVFTLVISFLFHFAIRCTCCTSPTRRWATTGRRRSRARRE
jgi:hypothetical protein